MGAALRAALRRPALSEEAVLAILDANARALEPGFPAGEGVLAAYLRGKLQAGAVAVAQAGGRVRLLRALPIMLSHGRHPLPPPADTRDADWAAAAEPVIHAARSWLGKARMQIDGADRRVIAAVLTLALVEPYLGALQDLGPDIVRRRADMSPLARVWRLWRASVLGRV